MTKFSFTFGSDPEFMLVDDKGQYRSAIGIVPGTKNEKVPLGDGHYAFYDNVMAECNIRPAHGKEKAVFNFKECFSRYARLVHPTHQIKMTLKSSHTYSPEECNHEDAWEFACDAEYDAYELNQIEPPVCESGNTCRSAGAHIHLGHVPHQDQFPLDDPMGKIQVVKLLDLFLGVPSVILDTDPSAVTRRKYYGMAGSHRPTNYGVEYRALSNFWLSTPEIVSVVHDVCEEVLYMVSQKMHERIFKDKKYDDGEIRKIINTCDKALARKTASLINKWLRGDLAEFLCSKPQWNPKNFYQSWGLT